MVQLRHDYPEFTARGAEVIVLGPESPAEFRSFWLKASMPCPGVPDPHHTVLNRYGQEFSLLKFGRMPAQLLVDMDGLIRYSHYGGSMSDITSHQTLFTLLDRLNERPG
jgi:peroxiredoxin Q/BCP